MKVKTTFVMPFRRTREGKTNYAKRLALIKSGKTRMVIRRTNTGFVIQFVQYSKNGDKILYNMHSSLLKRVADFPAKCNTPTAYLAGFYAAKQAKIKYGITAAIADINNTPSKGAVIFAAVKGAIDGGINIPFDESKIISDRLSGSHLIHLKGMKDIFEATKKKFEAK